MLRTPPCFCRPGVPVRTRPVARLLLRLAVSLAVCLATGLASADSVPARSAAPAHAPSGTVVLQQAHGTPCGQAGQFGQAAQAGQPFELVLLHTNDTHAHAAGRDRNGNASYDQQSGAGGAARLAARMKAIRAASDHVLVLDAGDQWQGSLYFSVLGWPFQARLNALMPWDALTLGNHEFDEGCEELARYLPEAGTMVLAANLAPGPDCPLDSVRSCWQPWRLFEMDGRKVAVIGLANDEVHTLARVCPDTHFTEARSTLEAIVRRLEAGGVDIIIALTHLGLDRDRELARSVRGVDVVVGGHTHSYLGPVHAGEPVSAGPYPIVEQGPDGQPVLVVTAKRAAQYLGELRVLFDAQGRPEQWSGGLQALHRDDPLDPEVAALVAAGTRELAGVRSILLGSMDLEFPDGMEACRAGECLSALVTTDAMLELGRAYGADIALANAGGFRAALPKGVISQGHVLDILPFGNCLVVRDYTGAQLRAALEHGVAEGPGPHLLQCAGLRYRVDCAREPGKRVLSVEVQSRAKGPNQAQGPHQAGSYAPLRDEALYRVILPSFLAEGGDGHRALREGRVVPSPEPLDADALADFIRRHAPLSLPETGRLVLVP